MHFPVFKNEVIEYLNPKPNQNFIDCTLGFAGHAAAILERTKPNGKVLGIEWDLEKIKNQELNIKNNEKLIVVNDSYANLKEIIAREKFDNISGILLDLGLSSWDFENSGRGFSFQKDERLDMRFSQRQSLTAEEIVNRWPEESIARILRDYGQERFARNIASKIIEVRLQQPIKTTFQLVGVIKKSFPRSYKFGKQHIATRTFQALRTAVNDELNNLNKVLPQALELLSAGGRIVVISFHSLEDRIVKNFFKEKVKQGSIKILTQKPVTPSLAEIVNNPRARSAKLRAALKV